MSFCVFSFRWNHVSSVCNHVQMSRLQMCSRELIKQEELTIFPNGLVRLLVVPPRTWISSVEVLQHSCLPSVRPIWPEPEMAALTGQNTRPESKSGRESLNRLIFRSAGFIFEISAQILLKAFVTEQKLRMVIHHINQWFSIEQSLTDDLPMALSSCLLGSDVHIEL